MSSQAKQVSKKIVRQRVHTTVQVLTILEKTAQEKNILSRLYIAFRYVVFKDFKGFFKD